LHSDFKDSFFAFSYLTKVFSYCLIFSFYNFTVLIYFLFAINAWIFITIVVL
jgi:hypothetical protein